MRKILLAAFLGTFVSIMPNDAKAAEVRDVGRMADAVARIQSIPRSPLAAATSDAIGSQVARALGLDSGSDLRLDQVREMPNNIGRTLRFNQTFNGIPIWGYQVVVEQDRGGGTLGIDGQAVFGIESQPGLAAQPALSPAQALQRAKQTTSRQAGLNTDTAAPYEREEATLVYYLGSDKQLKLSYKTSFFTTLRDAGGGVRPTRPMYIIDASTGETLDYYENIQHAASGTGPGGSQKTGRYVFGTGNLPKFEVSEQGNQCSMDSTNVKTENLNHATTGSGTPWQFQCHENTTKQINGAFSPLNDAQAFGKVVFDMYRDWYNTSPLTNKLHLRVHYSNGYENAFWDGQTMTFGDGASRFHPLVSLDVTAHEVSHGFTEQNSGLIYREQSGGMNEAFSDMAGEAAEYWFVQKYGRPFTRNMPDDEVGADIFKQTGAALRYMCDPPKDGRSIGHVRDYQTGMDVHYSSGVYNKVFCLLSKRGGWNVKKAFDVFVVANQSYWTPNETFQAGAEKTLKATQRLSYAEADVIWAFAQVGITLGAPPPPPPPPPPPQASKYLYKSLRVINNGNPRGCSYSNWNCMAQLCKSDLQDQNAWRGWAGCWQKGSNYICYFECGQTRTFF
jgi:vibriolysin